MQARRATSPSSTDQNRTQTATKTTRSHTCSCGSCSNRSSNAYHKMDNQTTQPTDHSSDTPGNVNVASHAFTIKRQEQRPTCMHSAQGNFSKHCTTDQPAMQTATNTLPLPCHRIIANEATPIITRTTRQLKQPTTPLTHRQDHVASHASMLNRQEQPTCMHAHTPARSCGKPCFYAQPTRTTDMHARPHTGKIMRQAMLLCSTDKNNRHACTPTHRQDHAAIHASMLNRQEQPTCMHAHGNPSSTDQEANAHCNQNLQRLGLHGLGMLLVLLWPGPVLKSWAFLKSLVGIITHSIRLFSRIIWQFWVRY